MSGDAGLFAFVAWSVAAVLYLVPIAVLVRIARSCDESAKLLRAIADGRKP